MTKKHNIPSDLNAMWDMLDEAKPNDVKINDFETKHALDFVWSEIEKNELKAVQTENKLHWRSYAVAASVLIAALSFYLFVPITERAELGTTEIVALSDGSTVTLNAGSEIKYNRLFNLTNRNIQLTGEAYFDVEKGKDPLRVNTYDAQVEVLGTQFNVNGWQSNNGTEVSVKEGRVSVSSKIDESSEIIIQDEAVQISESSVQFVDNTIKDDLAWLEGHFAFDNEELSSLFLELGRSYDVTITYESGLDLGSKITAYYKRPDQVESIIKDICQVKGLTYRKIQDGFVIE